MWFFMITCYISSLITFLCLVLAFSQSFFKFDIFHANHITFIILTSIIYSFTETLVIFFFVGTGVSVKEYCLDHKLDPSYHKRSIAIKRKVYPPLMKNLGLMIIVFILAGAVDTGRVPAWIYQALFLFGIWHYVRIKVIQNECFKDNTNIVLEMSGLKKV